MPSAPPADTDRTEPAVPFVLGGSVRRPSRAGVLSVALIAALVAIPLRGLYLGTGSSMEEGFMLVFPKRMMSGAVPNVDFLHLYGPGSLQILTVWYRVFGYTLGSQRTFGLLQHLLIISGMYALTRAWGYRIAVICAAAVTFLVLTPIGLSALAWEGGVGLGLWGVVFAIRGVHTAGRNQQRAFVAAGVLAGLSLSFRPDLIVALGLAFAAVLVFARSWKALALGTAVGLVPMWVHLAMAGIGPSWRGMVVNPVVDLRPGRQLPRPPSLHKIDGALQAVAEGPNDAPWWHFPSLSANHQLFLWFFVVIATAIGVPIAAFVLIRRSERTATRTALLVGSLFGLGMIGQALQRPDSTHLAWGSCISFVLLVPLARELLLQWRPNIAAFRVDLAAGVFMALTLLVVCPFYTFRYYLVFSRISVGNKQGGYEVHRGERSFYFGNVPLQEASQAAINQLAASSKPGERLLVGPADLSRTIYSDVVFYYLFPELTPATYYIEMDPGLADKPGSGLDRDVASADWVLLTNFWTGWYEPNASSNFGSDAPNQVVANQFCLVGNYDNALVMLYHRCAKGDGISPAGIGIGADRRASLDHELAMAAANA